MTNFGMMNVVVSSRSCTITIGLMCAICGQDCNRHHVQTEEATARGLACSRVGISAASLGTVSARAERHLEEHSSKYLAASNALSENSRRRDDNFQIYFGGKFCPRHSQTKRQHAQVCGSDQVQGLCIHLGFPSLEKSQLVRGADWLRPFASRPTEVLVILELVQRPQAVPNMTKCTLAAGAVPDRVHISKTKHQELTDMADGLIAETLHTYEFFVANGRQLSSDQWKLVKTREKVRVFRSRRGKPQKLHRQSHDEKDPSRPRLMSAGAMEQHQRQAAAYGRPNAYDDPIPDEEISTTTTNSSSSDAGSFSLFEDSVLAKVKPSHVPLIIATGQIDGILEDVAYGGLANTKHAWLVRNSYVRNDSFDDRKVLAVLQSPSEEDPFRSVTIKWGTADYGAFTTRRDFTYLESQGMAFDSDGERIFYYLIHSIELDDCPRLDLSHNIIRVQLSVAYITRQVNDDTVEMFGRGFVDPRGEMMESYGVMLLANNITSSAGIVECSNMKKLSYLMTQRRRSDASGIVQSNDCGVCHKSISRLGNLLQPPSGCPVCRRVTCSKCSVQKKLTIDATQEVTQKNFTFCLSCVIQAKELSAWEVASACLRS